MTDILDTSIEFLKGVGPSRAETLQKELSIYTFRDLLEHFPFRYVDRTKFYTISELTSESNTVQVKGKLTKIQMLGGGKANRLKATFVDDTGAIDLVWFKGAKWIRRSLKANHEYIMYGKPNMFNGRLNIIHPELNEVEDTKGMSRLQPVYPSTEKLSAKGMNSGGIERMMRQLILQVKDQLFETLPDQLIKDNHLLARNWALINIHFPENEEIAKKAEVRLKFEELFFTQLSIVRSQFYQRTKFKGFVYGEVGEKFKQFYSECLPFDLTGAQKRVIREIRKDTGSGRQMNRLLQGDVGSGKTIVATLCMLLSIDNGFQSCLMAPTEILANQHFDSISELLAPLNIKVGLLTGSVKKSTRKVLFEELANGEIGILIGTHAVLEDPVVFKNLGFVVIDEQHRFGVAQRARLWKKNTTPPHILVMTATPIPRTLAMTLYGDLDVSVIDELPPGRKSIKTSHRFDNSRRAVFGFIRKEIALGRQVYIVYPLIQESATMDYKDLMDGYESVVREFPLPEYKISIVHGQMKPEDKDYEMQRFIKGETQIMVATTVIEVGVNVPNASVMIIESSERFGLSQLHQLRGRVGRGAEQSYCILMTGYKLSAGGRTRMETMVSTQDGFVISEVDLKLRGPGEMMGTRQSGVLDLKIADLAKDQAILTMARNAATELLADDPKLEKKEHYSVRINYIRKSKASTGWSNIS